MSRQIMKKQKLSTHLIVNINVFVVVMVIVMASLVYSFTKSNTETILEEKTFDIIELLEQEAIHYINHPINEMQNIKERLNSDNSIVNIKDIFYMYNYLYHVDVINYEGEIIDTIPRIDSRIGMDLSNSDIYTDIRHTEDEFVIGHMLIDAYTDEPTMYISMKYKEGYIVGYLNLIHFQQLLESINIHGGHMSIVDELGTYISHTDVEKVHQRTVDPFSKSIRDEKILNNSVVEYLGKDVNLHFRNIEGTNWLILFYQDVEVLNEPIEKAILANTIVFLLILPLFILMTLRVIRRIDRSLKQLDETTEDIAEGNYEIKDKSFNYIEFDNLFNRVKFMSVEVSTREEEILSLNNELESNYYTTIVLLAKAIDAKDNYTGNHSVRVRDFALLLANELNLLNHELKELKFGATLHDIGKLGVPEYILNKSGRLTDDEYVMIKEHSQTGYNIVEELPGMNLAKQVILHHHERYDGHGYPYGLKGDEIPLLARIVTIADSFDAMTSERLYRAKQMSENEGFQELRENAGIQFDAELVELFINGLKQCD